MSPEQGPLDPADLSVTCPTCGEALWAERRGQWTLKAAILKLVGGRFVAKCPAAGCEGEAPVPWLKADGLRAPSPRRIGLRLDRPTSTG